MLIKLEFSTNFQDRLSQNGDHLDTIDYDSTHINFVKLKILVEHLNVTY